MGGVILATLASLVVYFGFYVQQSKVGTHLPKPGKGMKWSLNFQDDFNASQLDSTKWVSCYDCYNKNYDGCSNNGNHEEQWYTSKGVSFKDGNAILTATKSQTKGWDSKQEKNYSYKSGMISSGRPDWNGTPKWTGTYGYYEARVKLPGGKGIWPAFWLLPADKQWPPEIDVMELLGDKTNVILMTYFWPNGKFPPPKDTSNYTGSDFTQGWHTFAVYWQKNKIDWLIDGVIRKSVTSDNVPDKPMEVLLNLAVGGDLPGNPDEKTVFPAQMQIDYVRVYQQIAVK